MSRDLGVYALIGGFIGLFFGGFWEGIGAMTLIFIATKVEKIAG